MKKSKGSWAKHYNSQNVMAANFFLFWRKRFLHANSLTQHAFLKLQNCSLTTNIDPYKKITQNKTYQ